MKKTHKKLALRKESVRELAAEQLGLVVGGEVRNSVIYWCTSNVSACNNSCSSCTQTYPCGSCTDGVSALPK